MVLALSYHAFRDFDAAAQAGNYAGLPVEVATGLCLIFQRMKTLHKRMVEQNQHTVQLEKQVADLEHQRHHKMREGKRQVQAAMPASPPPPPLPTTMTITPPQLVDLHGKKTSSFAHVYTAIDELEREALLVCNFFSANPVLFRYVSPNVAASLPTMPAQVHVFRQQLHTWCQQTNALLSRATVLYNEMAQGNNSNNNSTKHCETKGVHVVTPTKARMESGDDKGPEPFAARQGHASSGKRIDDSKYVFSVDEVSQAEMFCKELSTQGKLVQATDIVTPNIAYVILQALDKVELPRRLDLSLLQTDTVQTFRGLVMAIANKDTVKDVTIASMPSGYLMALADSFSTGKLELLEIKGNRRRRSNNNKQRNQTSSCRIDPGDGVEEAFEKLSRIVTKSLAVFVYKRVYDSLSIVRGVARGFAKLSSRPTLRLALPLKYETGKVALGRLLLEKNIVTDLFIEGGELRDDSYEAIANIVQSSSLRRLYLCDVVLNRLTNVTVLGDAFRQSKLELLVLGGLTRKEDTAGGDFLNCLYHSLATGSAIQRIWLNFANQCRPWGVAQQLQLIQYLPSMKGLKAVSIDPYPETAGYVNEVKKHTKVQIMDTSKN